MENTYSGVACAEAYKIMSYMDKDIVMKVPIEILNYIKDNRDKNYKTSIDINDIFNPDNIQQETMDLLAWIDVKFWMSEEKKEELLEEYQREQREKYNPDNLFNNRRNTNIQGTTKENIESESMANEEKYIALQNEKLSFVRKIINRIKNIFKHK